MREDDKVIRISVRNLVEFILREGSIDNRISGSIEKDAMILGGKMHRRIQRKMGPEYHAEVSLKTRIPGEGYVLQVEGRADGIIIREQEEEPDVTIDEIKGVFRDLEYLEAPVNVHLAQAKCYAYIYAEQNNLSEISVQMTYCHLDTEAVKRFVRHYTAAELRDWFEELIRSYKKWAEFQIRWKEERDESIGHVNFPFPYRKGQYELAASVYRTILRKKKLFIQAPTGVGKTMSVLFPAVKAVKEGLGDKIFYLTAKTITRTVAEQAFRTLKEQGLKFTYADGHFDRVNDAVFDMITAQEDFSRESLERQARKHRVCPFELSLDVSVWMDAVICDYNYVFDPNAHLKRFFSEGGNSGYLFLIDEAHNLVERGREMYSAVLYKEDLLEAKRSVKKTDARLTRRLDETNRILLELKRECESYRVLESVSHLALKLMNLLTEMERFLEEYREGEEREVILNLYFQVRDFLNIHDILDENYVIYSELESDGRFKVKLFCVNPAANLQSFLAQGNSTVFFSATLLPIQYYKKLLSVETDDYAVYAESPFPEENRLLLIGGDVSTKYTLRGRSMYRRIAEYISAVERSQRGNYMIFFPSYRFMEDVYVEFTELAPDADTVVQTQFMNEKEREDFLERFEISDNGTSLIGFCVMGGIFSEGIDLAADRLIGAVVVGTGLPQVCSEREIVKKYFDSRGTRGFDYAYLYPGMNKVLQSAGRVIRTEEDRGVILLLDDRFRQKQYQDLFPREWKVSRICRVDEIEQAVKEFWKE